MRITKRAAVFVWIGLLTFVLGVGLTQLVSRVREQQRQPSPWEVLLAFENQDLEGLPEESRRVLSQAIESATGQPASDEHRLFEPAFFRKISNTSGEQRYLLVENAYPVIIPGESRMRVHVFDTYGRVLSVNDFAAGWRTVLTGFKVRTWFLENKDVLIVDGENVFGGHASRQYYAIIGNDIRLIYLSSDDDRFYPNGYSYRNQTIGPKICRSADEWEKALRSDDQAEVLSALVWLGGHHWDGALPPYDEDRADAEKVSSLLSRDEVVQRLKELSQSENTRIASAAQSALKNE